MLKFATKRKSSQEKENLEMFNHIISIANTLLTSNSPMRIYELIYSLGKPYQFEIINMCIKGIPISNEAAFSIEHLFLKNNDKLYRFIKVNEEGKYNNYSDVGSALRTIHPSDSLIYSFPWNSSRLTSAFNNIGNKAGNKWEHDNSNHRVIHIRPLNIGYIRNGNHSAVMNIIYNESPMFIKEEIDLEPVYAEIYTDGIYFRRIIDEKIIDEVSSVEFAAIFEIGRLILNLNIT